MSQGIELATKRGKKHFSNQALESICCAELMATRKRFSAGYKPHKQVIKFSLTALKRSEIKVSIYLQNCCKVAAEHRDLHCDINTGDN